MLRVSTSEWKDSQKPNSTPKRWTFHNGTFLLVFLATSLLVVQPTPALSECDEGLFAPANAICQFTHTTNDSLGLNATMWLPHLVNDSYIWTNYGNLTWAFDPNLAFWSFLWAELTRKTSDLIPKASVEEIYWSLPLKDWEKPDSNRPMGQLIDFNNGTYTHLGIFTIYPAETEVSDRICAVNNFTIIARDAPIFSSEYWFAEVYWQREGLSSAQWTELTDQLSLRLNATWYMKSCVFHKEKAHCDDNNIGWPFETVVLGLFALSFLGLVSKRRVTWSRKKAS